MPKGTEARQAAFDVHQATSAAHLIDLQQSRMGLDMRRRRRDVIRRGGNHAGYASDDAAGRDRASRRHGIRGRRHPFGIAYQRGTGHRCRRQGGRYRERGRPHEPPEIGTVPGKSWLQRLLADDAVLARDYVRPIPTTCRRDDRNVITAEEREVWTSRHSCSAIHIKRVPIVRDGKVVGIVSRANLLQGLLARESQPSDGLASDESVRTKVSAELAKHSWGSGVTNVVVDKGVVHLWGHVAAGASKDAVRIAVENVAGVSRVANNIVVMPRDIYFGV